MGSCRELEADCAEKPGPGTKLHSFHCTREGSEGVGTELHNTRKPQWIFECYRYLHPCHAVAWWLQS